MNLIGSCLTTLGTRHGLSIQPQNHCAGLIRSARHTEMKFNLEVGMKIGDKYFYAPFCDKSLQQPFSFYDEKLGLAFAEYKCVAEEYGIILTFEMYMPFRPRDEEYSSVPTILMQLSVKNMRGNFRWRERDVQLVEGEAFIKLDKNFFQISKSLQGLEASYDLIVESKKSFYDKIDSQIFRQTDVISVFKGYVDADNDIVCKFSLNRGEDAILIESAWNSYLPDIFEYRGNKCEFKYKNRFESIENVVKYSHKNYHEIIANAKKLDSLILGSDFGVCFDKLLCVSLHSFLMNTWLVKLNDRTIFSVWEGNCYFNSTVDVEYTQSPFYLSLFPNLLKYQLDMWPEFSHEAECGKFLAHDVGEFNKNDKQHYPHNMPIEENANYIIMMYLYYHATGDREFLDKWYPFVKVLLQFIESCDKTGNGMPDVCTENTLDDASSAMQYGKEQVYLGVKIANAYVCAHRIAKLLNEKSYYMRKAKKIIDEIELKGFDGHYHIALSDDSDGILDPWSNRPIEGKIPGVDASHIYTFNTYSLMAYAGERTLLNRERAKTDIIKSYRETLQTYGCRHTSYLSEIETSMAAGLAGNSPKSGWISMNMMRDIAAMRLGIDMTNNFQRYWDWILTVNQNEFLMFMETFAGNNLHFYPRGVVLFSAFSAVNGVVMKDGNMSAVRKVKGNYPILETIDFNGGQSCQK